MGRRALVTGASRGIGAAIARALAEAGHRVVLGFREREAAAQEVADEIRAAGGDATTLGFDVASAEQVAAAYARLDLAHDPVEIVVNNAGRLADGPFAGMKPPAWHGVLGASLDGFYYVTQPLVLAMARRRWGRVVNVVSHSGLSGNRGQVNYSAAKGGLVAATKALARELASRGITVNAVCPGFIDTEMLAGLDLERLVTRVPLGRLGRPEEVAAAVAFLVSDQASYINGHVLRVDGGFGS